MSPDLRSLWSQAAPAYAASSHDGAAHLMPLNKEIARALVARLQATGHTAPHLLDIASGSGEPACTIAHMLPSAQVTATDYAAGMVEEAKRRAQELKLANMSFEVADATNLQQFANDTFDGISCASSLFVFPDQPRALQEFKRVLKPGGILIVSVWGLPEETDCARLVGGVNRQLLSSPATSGQDSNKPLIPTLGNRKHFTSLLEQGGFDQLDIREFNCVFDMQLDDLLGNPMCLGTIENLQAQGKPNARQLLSAAITDAARLQGFLQPDGGLLFPRNVAIIAEMQAKT